MECFSFILKCRNLIINHIHKYKPGLIVLWSFVGKSKSTLLSQRFFRHIL